MREEARGVGQADGSGLIVAQWYVDALYDDVEGLPAPNKGKATEGRFKGKSFDQAVEEIEADTEQAITVALQRLRMQLAPRGVKLVVVER